ncbi:hypothetical protein E2C01_052804 [Portunus trituberculatus]|uniref:Uncharacterized protein n=1 Tax=Portunus trituberculatus TaxID=210409 RepID=A0A5B7GMU6_PORTR|nr:hypothetical protein [Portunus trituberculatus]
MTLDLTLTRGARIQEIKKAVGAKTQDFENGLLVIQGGGNDLERIGEEEIVKGVVEAVKAAEGKNLSVAVVGVIRRPREGDRYERLRRVTWCARNQESAIDYTLVNGRMREIVGRMLIDEDETIDIVSDHNMHHNMLVLECKMYEREGKSANSKGRK